MPAGSSLLRPIFLSEPRFESSQAMQTPDEEKVFALHCVQSGASGLVSNSSESELELNAAAALTGSGGVAFTVAELSEAKRFRVCA